MAKVAFLGTGLLGSGMVERMLHVGDSVTVWNRTESKARALESAGASVASSPVAAVAGAARVHMTFSDDAVVDRVMGEFLPALGKDTLVIDHTTTSPAGTIARYQRTQAAGVRFLHAPVFMSPQMARDAVGLVLSSAPQPLYDAARDALQNMTGEVWYLGEDPGRAAAYKLFGNSMIFVITAGIADVFTMARELDITPTDALAVFTKFPVGGVLKGRGEKMARADFSASFELTMARKDLRLMLEAAGSRPTTVLGAIAKQMDDAIAKGHGSEDLGAIAAAVLR